MSTSIVAVELFPSNLRPDVHAPPAGPSRALTSQAGRLADVLFRWTVEATYLDYIERNLYNGILAQQHPSTGMVTYFLPLEAGAHKKRGTPLEDFIVVTTGSAADLVIRLRIPNRVHTPPVILVDGAEVDLPVEDGFAEVRHTGTITRIQFSLPTGLGVDRSSRFDSFRFTPLYQVQDENYTVYFPVVAIEGRSGALN